MSAESGPGGPFSIRNITLLPNVPASITPTFANGFIVNTLNNLSGQFDLGVTNLNAIVQATLANAQSNPSDPKALADYQSALGDYTTYRGLQSSSIKAFKDIAMQIIQNI